MNKIALIKEFLSQEIKSLQELFLLKKKISEKYRIPLLKNFEILELYHSLLRKKRIKRNLVLEKFLKIKKIRSLSGIISVSVLTKPYPCPGNCLYCPKEEGIPKSYLKGEPAVERARMLNFDPYLQVQKRLEILERSGHPTDKIELRIIGGSFSSYPLKYKIWFLANCFAGANKRKKLKSANWELLEKEQKINENSKRKIVGISIETRPDLINEKEIVILRKLGVTLVELGIQTIFDEILKKCNRRHTTKEIISATKLLKDSGFKVLYHIMPNLPFSNLQKDFECFKKIIKNKDFKPDWLKIYPTVVCENSPLYNLWKKGKYQSYSNKELINLLIKFKKNVPRWIRITRIIRDIPASKIKSGCKISNLREFIKKEMEKRNLKCNCLRCREIREEYNAGKKIYLFREDYEASEGKEIFLSFEDKKREKIYSFLRLRIPSLFFKKRKSFLKVLNNCALIREIHTYGKLAPVGKKISSPQHRGLGKKLVKEAEKIAKKEFNLPKITVISGIGVRNYWRKLGYCLRETYMTKNLKN